MVGLKPRNIHPIPASQGGPRRRRGAADELDRGSFRVRVVKGEENCNSKGEGV